jgi:hypothetical protein
MEICGRERDIGKFVKCEFEFVFGLKKEFLPQKKLFCEVYKIYEKKQYRWIFYISSIYSRS